MTQHRWSVTHRWSGGVCTNCGLADGLALAESAGHWDPLSNAWTSEQVKQLYDLRPCLRRVRLATQDGRVI